MSNDIASLGLRVESGSVKDAADDLDQLTQAGARAEQAAGKAGNAWTSAASKMSQAGAPAERMSKSFGKGTEEIKSQQQELAKLLGKIDPVVAALGRLDNMEEQLRKHAASGILPKDDFTEYSQKIQAMRSSLGTADDQIARTGNSAKQTAAALRMLPAQFSDIAVSLQAGQSPFQVLLQQGSQIKDSFGGIGPALASTGRYALSLVNPFTVAAAAVTALALAYKQGSDEQTAFDKAIIQSGNIAGATSSSLAAMAKSISATVGTTREAAAALTEFVQSGKFTGDQLQEMTTAAVAWENATGRAVSDTIAEFAKLADDPVKSAAQLNDEYHFLTAAVYEQITALEKQGNTEEAAALAQKAYADALRDRSTQVIQSLGYIETAWKNIKEGAASAWDAMLGVGREQTPQQRLEELNKPAGFDQKGFFTSGVMFGPLGALYNSYKQFDAATTPEEDRRQEKAFLEQQLATKEAIAKAQGLYAEEQKKGVDAQREVDAIEKQFLTNAEKRNKEIKEYRRQLDDIRKANPNDARLDEDRIAKNIANIEAKYKDPKTPKTKAYRDDEATRLLLTLQQQEASLSEQLNVDTKLSESKKQQIKFEQLIADLKTKDILTADQKSLLANQDAIRSQLEKNSALDDEIAKRKDLQKIQAYQMSLESRLRTAQDGYDIQVAGVGLGRQESQRAQEQLRIRQQYQRQQDDLLKQYNSGDLKQSVYDQQTKDLSKALDKQLEMQKDHYGKLDAAQQDWLSGAKAGFADFLDESQELAATTQHLVTDTLNGFVDGLSDSIGRAIVQGDDLRESLSNVAQTIETELISALVKIGIQYGINAAMGITALQAETTASTAAAAQTTTAWAPAATAASIGSFGTAAAVGLAAVVAALAMARGFKTGGYTGSGNPFDVAGVVHKGEYVMTADTVNRLGVDNLDAIQKGRAISSALPAANDSSAAAPGQRRVEASGNTYHITVNQPNVTNATEARKSSMAARREIGMLVQGTGRAM